MLGIDFSIYSAPRPITRAEWASLKDQGFEVAVAGLWTGRAGNLDALESLQNARAEGYKIAGYTALNGYQDGGFHVDKALAFCWQILDQLSFLALDCELDGITSEHIQAGVTACRAAHVQPWIYSGKWWWDKYSLWDFSHIPLLTAQYDGLPSLHTTQGYGGWNVRVGNIGGKQWSDTTPLLPGLSFDKNTFLASYPWR